MDKVKLDIVAASKNKGKIAEIQKFLGSLRVNILSLADFAPIPDAPETGTTFLANACQKASYYAKHTGKLCLADDSGILADALGQEPGIYSARYAGPDATDHDNNIKLLAKLHGLPPQQRGGKFWCALALSDASGVLATVEEWVEGVILTEGRGHGGFGYDPLFLLVDINKTMAEISTEEKNLISHRGKALKKLAGHPVWAELI